MNQSNKMKRWAPLTKITKVLSPVVAVFAITLIGFATNSANADIETWGPQDRATFTMQNPADYATFNSITDNNVVGDERNFVRVREANTEDDFTDNIKIKPGAQYEVFVWFHNNAKSRLNTEQDGIGMANNARLLLSIPEIVPAGDAAAIKATISADNANPKEVWDLAFAEADQGVALRFVPNSAVIHLNEPGTYDAAKSGWYDARGHETVEGQILNEDALFGRDGYGGAKLAYWNGNWGYVPGCTEYSGYVTFLLQADQPNFEMNKTVSKASENNFSETITANPGDILEFKIEYKNTGTTIQEPVAMTDNLPDGLSYIEGSTYFWSSRTGVNASASDNLFNGGLNLGGFEPGDSATVTYQVRVEDNSDLFPCGDTKIYNEGIVGTDDGSGHDSTEITVHRLCDCATNPEMPGCQELPSTGPVEAAIALTIVVAIGGGGYYYYRTHKALDKVTKGVMGGGSSHTPGTSADTPNPDAQSSTHSDSTNSDDPSA